MMAKAPTSSYSDCPFFFEPFHGEAVSSAKTLAMSWTPDHGRDVNHVAREAVTRLAQGGLMGFVVPERFGGVAVGRGGGGGAPGVGHTKGRRWAGGR